MSEESWSVSIYMTGGEAAEGWITVNCTSLAETSDIAINAVESIVGSMTEGKTHLVRTLPHVVGDTNFDTQTTTYRGRTRFAFKNEPGAEILADRQYEEETEITGFGRAKD